MKHRCHVDEMEENEKKEKEKKIVVKHVLENTDLDRQFFLILYDCR